MATSEANRVSRALSNPFNNKTVYTVITIISTYLIDTKLIFKKSELVALEAGGGGQFIPANKQQYFR